MFPISQYEFKISRVPPNTITALYINYSIYAADCQVIAEKVRIVWQEKSKKIQKPLYKSK